MRSLIFLILVLIYPSFTEGKPKKPYLYTYWILGRYHQYGVKGDRMTFDDAVDIAKGVAKYSQENGIDQDWMLALFDVENHFHSIPSDGRGSHGIPQLQVDVAQAVATELGLQITVTSRLLEENSDLAIQLACRNFKDELNSWGGDYMRATRSYNFGDKRVKRNRLCGLKYFDDVFKVYWALEKYKNGIP